MLQTDITLESGITVTVTPLSELGRQTYMRHAELMHPDPSGTYDGPDGERQRLIDLRDALNRRMEAAMFLVLGASVTCSSAPDLIAQHREMLDALKAAKGLPADTNELAILLFMTDLATEAEIEQITALAYANTPIDREGGTY